MNEHGKEVCRVWSINEHALWYFGIMCFTDIPGYYPQLERSE